MEVKTMQTTITYLGGPTYLIEIGSFRFLSDPGFDPEGNAFPRAGCESLAALMKDFAKKNS